MKYCFSTRTINARPSDIRELTKAITERGLISFAGGNPDPALFPIEAIQKSVKEILEEDGKQALQYGPTEGYRPLREYISKVSMASAGVSNVTPDQIQIVNGSQQGIDLLCKAFLDKGDVVICERPTYSGLINATRAYECRYCDIPVEADGMRMDLLEETLKREPRAKFIYTIPDFQNPSCGVMSLEKRKQLLALSCRYHVPIIEDGPYSEICFGSKLPSIKSLDTSNAVIYLGSFSKILSPGLRTAWICATPEIIRLTTIFRQGTDLQSSSLDQRIVMRYMQENDHKAHVAMLVEKYRVKCNVMMDAIRAAFPESVRYVQPQGGFFTWLTFPERVRITDILPKIMEAGVAIVPGRGFFATPGGDQNARLSYITESDARIVEWIDKLSKVLRQYC